MTRIGFGNKNITVYQWSFFEGFKVALKFPTTILNATICSDKDIPNCFVNILFGNWFGIIWHMFHQFLDCLRLGFPDMLVRVPCCIENGGVHLRATWNPPKKDHRKTVMFCYPILFQSTFVKCIVLKFVYMKYHSHIS